MLKKIELPYSLNALEPYYDRETLDIHYNKLYESYINKTNETLQQLEMARTKNEFENIKCLEKNLSFFGSGVILHEIEKDFGGFINFKNQFTQSSLNVEASGWNLLVWVPNFKKLEILQCEKHQNLTLWGCIPLLVLDMWEHSYFLQYKSSRQDYINAFWNIVNWNQVNKRWEEICPIYKA